MREFLSAPVDPISIALFRMLIGGVMLVYFFRNRSFFTAYYTHSPFYFYYEWTPFIKPLNRFFMKVIFHLMVFFAFLFTLGFFYRFCAVVLFLMNTYVLLLDKTMYSNRAYLWSLFLFLFSFVDGAKVFSLDSFVWYSSSVEKWIPYWQLFIFKAQIGIVYFYGGVNQITFDRLFRAMPLRKVMKSFVWRKTNHYKNFKLFIHRRIAFFVERLLQTTFFPYFISWLLTLLDLLIILPMFFEGIFYFALPIYFAYVFLDRVFYDYSKKYCEHYFFVVLFLNPEIFRSIFQSIEVYL